MNKIITVVFALWVQAWSYAALPLKVEADSAYARESYQEAAHKYEDLLKEGHSADVYYNLGNCYYRLEKIGPSILNYEKALMLNPGDSHIRHNLELARQKTLDKITPIGEIFIITWYKAIISWLSVDEWAELAILCFILLLITATFYLFGKNITLRKVCFYVSILSLVVCIIGNIFAWNQKYILLHRNKAVVMQTSVNVKSTPNASGTDLFVIHEGTKVTITDPNMKGWKEIKLDNGKTGWIPTESIELI